jgi:hypothetical protein
MKLRALVVTRVRDEVRFLEWHNTPIFRFPKPDSTTGWQNRNDRGRIAMMNKEYRLASWPELSPAHHRTAYRRMLSEMSQRYVSLAQLVNSSGLKRPEVKHFLQTLESSGKLIARDACALKASRWAALRGMSTWFRRTPAATAVEQR